MTEKKWHLVSVPGTIARRVFSFPTMFVDNKIDGYRLYLFKVFKSDTSTNQLSMHLINSKVGLIFEKKVPHDYHLNKVFKLANNAIRSFEVYSKL